MNRLLNNLLPATAMLAAAFAFSSTLARAQDICVVEGGRTTVTLSPEFTTELASLKVTPGAVNTSQLYGSKVFFPITSGAFSLDSARGQILHSGGITLTEGKTEVKLESFIINTLDEKPFVTGLVIANGKFLGRVKVFDLELPSDLVLPIDPKDGDFFLSDVKLTLSGEAASALNDAFNVSAFAGGEVVGHSLSLVLVPLSADGH